MTTYFKQGIEVRGNAKIIGHTEITGSTIVGDLQSEDLLAVNSRITTDLIPHLDCAHDLGTPNLRWNNLYAKTLHLDVEAYEEGRILFAGPNGRIDTSFDLQWNDSTKQLTLNGGITATGEDAQYQFGDVVIEDNTIGLANNHKTLYLLADTSQTLVVGGNLEVLGSTVSVATSNTAFLDPIITLGGEDTNTILTEDDPYDRGIEYLCYDEDRELLNATDMVIGERYIVETIVNNGAKTNYTKLGAKSNASGTLFTASEVACVVGRETEVNVTNGIIEINGTDFTVRGPSAEIVVADINEENSATIYANVNDSRQVVISSRGEDLEIGPARRIIKSITKSTKGLDNVLIVEADNHGFTNGMAIEFDPVEGMIQLDVEYTTDDGYYVETIDNDNFYVMIKSGGNLEYLDGSAFTQFLTSTTQSLVSDVEDPVTSRNDSIVVNGQTVTFRGGDLSTIVDDFNDADVTNITAQAYEDGNRLELVSSGVDIDLRNNTSIKLGDITNITVDNTTKDVTVHAPNHGLSLNETVFIDGVKGTTQANGVWYVGNASRDTFELYTDIVTPADGTGWGAYQNNTETVVGNTVINTYSDPLVNAFTEFSINNQLIQFQSGAATTVTLEEIVDHINNSRTDVQARVATRDVLGVDYKTLEIFSVTDTITDPISVAHRSSSFGGITANVGTIGVAGTTVTISAPRHGFVDGTRVIISGVTSPSEINGNIYIVDNATTNTFELLGATGAGWDNYTSGGVVSSRPLDLLGIEEQTVQPNSSGSVYNDTLANLGFASLNENADLTNGVFTFDRTLGRSVSYVYSTMLQQLGIDEGTYAKPNRQNAAVVESTLRTPKVKAGEGFWIDDGTNVRTILARRDFDDIDEIVLWVNTHLTNTNVNALEDFTVYTTGENRFYIPFPIDVDSNEHGNFDVVDVTLINSSGSEITLTDALDSSDQYDIDGQILVIHATVSATIGDTVRVTLTRKSTGHEAVDVVASNNNGLLKLTGGVGLASFTVGVDDWYSASQLRVIETKTLNALTSLHLVAGTYSESADVPSVVQGDTKIDDSTSEYTADDSVEGGTLTINGVDITIAAGSSLEDVVNAINVAATSTAFVTASIGVDSIGDLYLQIEGDYGIGIAISGDSDVLADLGLSVGTTPYIYGARATTTSNPSAFSTTSGYQFDINDNTVTLSSTHLDGVIQNINDADIENVVASKNAKDELVISYFGNPDNGEEMCIDYTPAANIINITQANPARVTTSSPHGLNPDSTHEAVILQHIDGALGEQLNGNVYYADVIANNSFDLYDNVGNPINTVGKTFVAKTSVDVSGTKLVPSATENHTIQLNGFTISLNNNPGSPTQTLEDVVDAINDATTDTGVTASIDPSNNQIVLTGVNTDIEIRNGTSSHTALQDLGLVDGNEELSVSTITGTGNPTVTNGYNIIINGITVTFVGGDHNNIVDDINNAMFAEGRTDITASFDSDNANNIVLTGNGVALSVSAGSESTFVAVSGVYQTNPVKIVAYNHGLRDGTRVEFNNVVGTDVTRDYPLNGNTYTVTSVTQDTFVLEGVNGTAWEDAGDIYPNAVHQGETFENVLVGDEIVINGRLITFTRDSNGDGIADINDVINDINTAFPEGFVVAERGSVDGDAVLKLTGYGQNITVAAGSTDQYYDIVSISNASPAVMTIVSDSTVDSTEISDLGICLRLTGIEDSLWTEYNYDSVEKNCYFGKRISDTKVELYNSYNPTTTVEGDVSWSAADSTEIFAGDEFIINGHIVTISSNTAVTQSMSDVADDIIAAGIPGLTVNITSDDRLQLVADRIVIEKTGESGGDDAILDSLGLYEGTWNGTYSDPLDTTGEISAYTAGSESAQAIKKITDQLDIVGTETYDISGDATSNAVTELGLEGTSNTVITQQYTRAKNSSVYGNITNPTVVVGNTIKINGRVITFTGPDLNSVVSDINITMGIQPAINITAFNIDNRLNIVGGNIDIEINEHLHGLNAVTDLGIEPGTYAYSAYADAVLRGSKPIALAGEGIYINGVYAEFSGTPYIIDVVQQINLALDNAGILDITASTEDNELTFTSAGRDIVLSNASGTTTLQDRFGLTPGTTRFEVETVSEWSSIFSDLGIEPGCYPVVAGFDDVGTGTVVLASSTTKRGFFGVDKGTNRFTYIPEATIFDNQVDFWKGAKGDVHFGKIYADDGICSFSDVDIRGRLEVDGESRFYKTLRVGDGEWGDPDVFNVNAITGQVTAAGDVMIGHNLFVDGWTWLGNNDTDRVEVRGSLGVDVQATLRSANVEDLTNDRIVVAGQFGELEDDANLTYNGFKLSVGQDNIELFNTGDVNIQGNLFVANPGAGEATFQRVFIETLSHRRVPFVSEFGELIDDGSMRYFLDDPNYAVPTLQLTGDINVDTQATLASANVEDLTMHRIVFVGNNDGELVDDANLMWDTATFYVNGRAEIDNIEIDGNKITTLGNCSTEEVPETVANIVSASNTNPIVVTTNVNHGFKNGDTITVDGIDVASMVEINGRSFEVLASSGTSFSLKGEDGTNYNSFVPVYDFYFIEGPTLDATRLANMPSQARLRINGRDVTLSDPTNLRQIILDIGTDDQGLGAPAVGANIPGVRAKIWRGLATTGTGTGDEHTGLVLQVDKNIAGSVTIEEHPNDARNDSLYNAGQTPKVLGFVPGVYNELGFTELADAVPTNPTQTVLVSTTEPLNTGGGFTNGSVLEINSPIELGNRMVFPFTWIQAHILDKLVADNGKIVLGTTGTANTTIEADLTDFESNVDSLYPRVEFRAITDNATSTVGYRMSVIHNDRTTFTDYDYDNLAAFPDTGGWAFEAHDNFLALMGTTDQNTLNGTGSLRYNEPTINFWAEHYRSLADTDTSPIGRTTSRGIRMFIGASTEGITLPTSGTTGGNVGQFTITAGTSSGGSTNNLVTDWNKIIDFNNDYIHVQEEAKERYTNALRMDGHSGAVAPNSDPSLTVESATTPWITSCVFQPGGPLTQATGGGTIWKVSGGSGSDERGIRLIELNGHIWFEWGEAYPSNANPGAIPTPNRIRIIENADPDTWYGVYIGFRGQRSTSPNAAFLGQAFDIHVMSSADSFASVGPDISTSLEWSQSHNTTGHNMTLRTDGAFWLGNAYGTSGSHRFKGKMASMVVATQRNGIALPDTTEIISLITDPQDWLDGTVGTLRRRVSGGDIIFEIGTSSATRQMGWVTQVWLMGDGVGDQGQSIRNQAYPNDTRYSALLIEKTTTSTSIPLVEPTTVNPDIPGLTDGVSLSAPTSIYVTVANGKYYLDGVEQATVTLEEGKVYRLDQSDTTNTGHPIRLSTTVDGTHAGGSEYNDGVSYVGTPGTAGSYTEITVATGAPTLYYYCTNHSGMGGTGVTATPIEATWVDQPLSIVGVVQTRPIAPEAPATIDTTTDTTGQYFYVVGSNTDIELANNVAVWINNTKVVFSSTASLSVLANEFNASAPAGVEWIDTNPNGSAATTMVLRVDRTLVSELEIAEDAYSTVAYGAVSGPSTLYPYNDTVYMGFDARAGVRYGVYAPAGYSSEVTLNQETTLPNIVSTATPTATRALIPASDAGCHLILDTDPTNPNTRIHHNSVAVFNEGTTAITMIEASDFTMMDNNTPPNIVYNIDGNTGNVVTQGSITVEDVIEVNRTLNSTHPTNGSIQTAGGLGVEMDAWIGGTLYVVGDTVIAGNLQLGDQDTDTITFSADVVSSILPDISNTFDLGNAQKSWRRLHLTESLNFEGGNQQNHINFPTNLQDGLSISSDLVDFIRFESTAGNPQVHILQDASYEGTMDVVGQTTMSSATVEDLTDNRVVIVGPGGELEDDSNFTFDGLHLKVGTTPSDMFTVEVANGDVYTAGTLEVDGQSTLASANIEDLTNDRIVIVGIDGELEDDANFTFDGAAFNIGQGEFVVDVATGNTDIDGTLNVAGNTRVESTLGTTSPTNGAFIVDGGVGIGENLEVGGIIHVRSDAMIHGDTYLGDSATEDNIHFIGRAATNLIPNTDDAYDLGSATLQWANVFAHTYNGDEAIFGNVQIAVNDPNEIDTVVGDLTLDSANGNVVVDDNLRTVGIATFENVQQSTDNNNGSVVIVGGLGVRMNTNIGGELDVDSDAFFHENVHLDDTKELRFGSDIDATVQWDTLTSALVVETSKTSVNSDRFEVSKTDASEFMITADADASVDFYYDGSRKAHTTLEGFTVENQLAADVHLDVHASDDALDSEIHFTAPGMTTATIIADHNAVSTNRSLRMAAAGAENIAIVDDRVFLHGDIDNDRTPQLLGDVMVGKTSQAGNTLGIIGGTGDAQISFYESAQSRADVYWDNSENKFVINDTRYTPDGTEGVFNLTHQTISLWTDEANPAGNTPTDGVVFRDPSIDPIAVLSLSNESSNSTTNNPLLRLSKGTTGPQIAIRQSGAATGFIGASASDNDMYIEGNAVGLRFDDSLTAIVPAVGQGTDADNQFDLGNDTNRWRDIHYGNDLVHTHFTETADKNTLNTTVRSVIAEFSAAEFGAAKFIITATTGAATGTGSGPTERSSTEILVVHDGTTAEFTQYAVINTGTTLAQYDVELVGGSVRLMATSTYQPTTYNIVQTLIV